MARIPIVVFKPAWVMVRVAFGACQLGCISYNQGRTRQFWQGIQGLVKAT